MRAWLVEWPFGSWSELERHFIAQTQKYERITVITLVARIGNIVVILVRRGAQPLHDSRVRCLINSTS